MMKTAEQLILNAKSRIQEVSVAELFEAMKNHK
ncbi:MAG: rhodanese-like domain-containing protein, partial [Acinetobacter sp.]